MPSTPFAASAADTPIASAKRPKRRAQQPLSSPARRAALGIDRNESTRSEGVAEELGSGGSDGASTEAGGGDMDGPDDLEAPSPPKARKGSMSSTPRSSGLQMDGRSEPPGRPSLGEAGEGSSDREDQNRHKPKESSIFSPALRPDHHAHEEPREDQAAPASTVLATAEQDPATPPSGKGSQNSGAGAGAGADSPQTADCGAEGVIEKAKEEAGGNDGDEPPGLRIRESEDGVVEVAGGEGEEEEGEGEGEDDEEEFNPYCFIAHLPPYNTVKHHTPEAPALPEKRKTRNGKELTLVLDLDETLVHCTVEPIVNPDHRFEVHFNGEEFQVYVRKRPHLDVFLEAVSELFEVVVFTASQQVYAERLLNMIDPQKKFVKYRLYRDACMSLEGNYLKDLNVLGRDLSKVAIVDNSPYAYGFQIDNGIPIESWFDDSADEELLHLLPLLKQLITESETAGGDVRPFIRSIFKTHELVDKARNGARDVSASPPPPPAGGSYQAKSEPEQNAAEKSCSDGGAASSEGSRTCTPTDKPAAEE